MYINVGRKVGRIDAKGKEDEKVSTEIKLGKIGKELSPRCTNELYVHKVASVYITIEGHE